MLQSTCLASTFSLARALAVAILLGSAGPPAALAQDRVFAPSDPTELIGAKVFTANGSEVGEVAAVLIGAGDEITEMRMTTGSPLGVGPRTVVLPLGDITLLRGAVVLHLSPSEVDMLPSAPEGNLKNPMKL